MNFIQARILELKCPNHLKNLQWIVLEDIVKILAYFRDVAKALSSTQVTLVYVIPLVNSFYRVLELFSYGRLHMEQLYLIQGIKLAFCEIRTMKFVLMPQTKETKLKLNTILLQKDFP